jgi:hypothetical protein
MQMYALQLVSVGEHMVVAVDNSIDDVTDDHDSCTKFIVPLVPITRSGFGDINIRSADDSTFSDRK